MSHLKVTCNECGFTVEQSGPDVRQIMRNIDAAHDIMRPDCKEAIQRIELNAKK